MKPEQVEELEKRLVVIEEAFCPLCKISHFGGWGAERMGEDLHLLATTIRALRAANNGLEKGILGMGAAQDIRVEQIKQLQAELQTERERKMQRVTCGRCGAESIVVDLLNRTTLNAVASKKCQANTEVKPCKS